MKLISKSPGDTLKIGRMIAKTLRPGDIICLLGDLGSGKTVLTKGIASGLGIKVEEVISPTFVIIREYQGKLPLYHFDLYRIEDCKDILSLGYDEYFFDAGVTVVEWAERLNPLMPKDYLEVKLMHRPKNERLLKFSAKGRRYENLLEKLDENLRH